MSSTERRVGGRVRCGCSGCSGGAAGVPGSEEGGGCTGRTAAGDEEVCSVNKVAWGVYRRQGLGAGRGGLQWAAVRSAVRSVAARACA